MTLGSLYKAFKNVCGWVIPIAVVAVPTLKFLEDFVNFRREVGEANKPPATRPVPIDVPDKKGYKQVKVESAKKDPDTPIGVKPASKVESELKTTTMQKIPTEQNKANSAELNETIDEVANLIKKNK